jgi:hypothetical protein
VNCLGGGGWSLKLNAQRNQGIDSLVMGVCVGWGWVFMPPGLLLEALCVASFFRIDLWRCPLRSALDFCPGPPKGLVSLTLSAPVVALLPRDGAGGAVACRHAGV